MPTLESIESPKMLQVEVSGPGDANRLLMFSGIAVFNWQPSSDDRWEGWIREPLRIPLLGLLGADELWQDQVRDHAGSAALGAFSLSETRRTDTWGFAVDEVDAWFTADRGQSFSDFGLTVQVAVRGGSARMFRISFQLNVLARL